MIETLIDKQDGFEIVRDQIAAILVTEVANQKKLAADAGKNADDWNIRIFSERSNPWEQFENDPTDRSPLVNVWYDNSTFDLGSSNVVEKQKGEGTFNLDCYGYGKSKDNPVCGHNPGDEMAALDAQRAVRLVRNILMAAEYTYLGVRKLVWRRMPQAISVFQPQANGQHVQHVVGARIALGVGYTETSPQVQAQTLELVSVDVKRTEDGEIVLEADYPQPPP